MAQRSTGIFPREKFDLDASMEVTITPAPSPVRLNSVNTWKAIVIGADGLGEGGEGGYLEVWAGSNSAKFYNEDLDANGVGIAYIRGSDLESGDNLVNYEANYGASAEAVYLDAVDKLR